MTFNALAIDLDGTLLVGDELPDANRDAVIAAHRAGMKIVIATARWRQMAERICDQLGIVAPIISCNGAQVFDPVIGQDIYDHRLPTNFTQRLFEICNQERCIVTVSLDHHTLLKLEGEPDASLLTEEMRWAERLDIGPVAPRIVTVQGSRAIRRVRDDLGGDNSVNITDSIGPNDKIILTITAKLASKGDALTAACKHLGVDPGQVIAFGDAENDIEMFKVAGISVAMGNAAAHIKAAASLVTDDNTESGVANTINRFLATGEL